MQICKSLCQRQVQKFGGNPDGVSTMPQVVIAVVDRGLRPEVPPASALPTPPLRQHDAYVALMRRCWATDPAERPAFDAVICELRCGPPGDMLFCEMIGGRQPKCMHLQSREHSTRQRGRVPTKAREVQLTCSTQVQIMAQGDCGCGGPGARAAPAQQRRQRSQRAWRPGLGEAFGQRRA